MTTTSRTPFLRSSLGRIAVTGAAALATTFAVSPAAIAADDDVAPETQTSEVQPSETPAPDPESSPPDPAAVEVPVEDAPPPPTTVIPPAVELATKGPVAERMAALEAADPAYVDQTITVSAGIGDSSVEPGTSTAGTVFEIVITDAEGTPTTTTCTTDATTLVGSESFCLFDDGDGGTSPNLTIPAGSSVAVTVTAAPTGLTLGRNRLQSAEPVTEEGTQALRFFVFGPAPVADTDYAETDEGTAIDIDVTDNDLNVGPDATLAIDTAGGPSNGSAELVDRPGGEPGTQLIRYTPDADFVGNDEFGYTVTTSEGSSYALVEMQVNAAEVLAPNFGSQKYRIGVQIADGSYVPDGATTAGSTFSIKTTSEGGVTTTTTCTTGAAGPAPQSYSACPGQVITIPGGGIISIGQYVAPAGATVEVTQTTVPDDALVPAADPMVIEPCDSNVSTCNIQNLTFQDRGSILPDTTDDSASTDAGEPVVIDVLANDTSDDPNTELSIDGAPSNGTAKVVGSSHPTDEPPAGGPIDLPLLAGSGDDVLAAVANEGTLAVRYTPKAGFSGVDTFTYALANGNGSTSGTVSVTVRGGEVIDSSEGVKDTDGVLPDTGGSDASMLGLAALLLAGGGTLLARGRRGPRGIDLG